jgi:tetratricopeptide (TPR) repeat protein
MEKRPVAGIAHSNDTKHRIVRFPGQPLPDVAFEQPRPDLPGLLWMNRPVKEQSGDSAARLPDLAQLEAYFTAARRDASLWPYWIGKLNELSKTEPNDPTVLASLGAVALAQKKDNAEAARDFALAIRNGSQEAITYLNLATALEGLGRGQEAESVLERGVALYPYSGQMTARLAQQYAMNGEQARARKLIDRYRALFPEDTLVREAAMHLDSYVRGDPLTGAGRLPAQPVPK